MTKYVDPDDAPEWTAEIFDRAEIKDGDAVIKPATGTLTGSFSPEAKAKAWDLIRPKD